MIIIIKKVFEEIVEGLESRAESCKRFSPLCNLDKNIVRAQVLSDIAGVIRSVLLKAEERDSDGC